MGEKRAARRMDRVIRFVAEEEGLDYFEALERVQEMPIFNKTVKAYYASRRAGQTDTGRQQQRKQEKEARRREQQALDAEIQAYAEEHDLTYIQAFEAIVKEQK